MNETQKAALDAIVRSLPPEPRKRELHELGTDTLIARVARKRSGGITQTAWYLEKEVKRNFDIWWRESGYEYARSRLITELGGAA